MGTRRTPVSALATVGSSVTRCGLATTFLWVGALKFKDYEVENAEVLVTASPLTSRLRSSRTASTASAGRSPSAPARTYAWSPAELWSAQER
jgi:uncharacterized membrane protein YkgB